ncbi:MAG: uracil-xanthine permease family protein [Defluviitaleaceae bacterium]|nr:uracil-xanthine permease family protein [Defluviitaleaceae bacterium]
MNNQKSDVFETGIKDARSLGMPKMLLLGLQHMFAMFGATVLVPLLTGLSIQVTLIFAGVDTLLFHLFSKFKVPAFLGSSFAFLGGFAVIQGLNTGVYAGLSDAEKLPYALGGIVVSGFLYLIVALLVKTAGARKVMRFLPPIVTGPIIMLIGLNLAPVGVGMASNNWLLAFIAFAVIVVCNIWGKGMVKILPILLGLGVAYLVAIIMHFAGATNPDGSAILDFTMAQESAWVGLPPFMLARFELQAILIMVPIAIATVMEHIGDISAIGATVGEDFIEDPGLHRTLLGDGLATITSSMFGSSANTTYGENTGVLVLSKVYDPRVVRIAAFFAIILSLTPKMEGIISTVPVAIIGGISFVLYGMIAAVGVRSIVENKVDFTKTRNVIIAAVILVSGLGFSDGLTFNIAGTYVTLTSLAIASIAGIVLNAVLPGNDYVHEKKNKENA